MKWIIQEQQGYIQGESTEKPKRSFGEYKDFYYSMIGKNNKTLEQPKFT